MSRVTYIKQLIKEHLKSPWSVIFVVPILPIFILIYQSNLETVFTVGILMSKLGYINMFMGIVYAMYGAYCSFSINDFDFSLFHKSTVIFLRIISGLFISTLSVLAVLLLVSVMSLISGISLQLYVSYFVYILLKFNSQILVLFILGFLLGLMIKTRILYLAATFLYFIFSPFFDVLLRSHDSSAFIRSFLNLAFENPNYWQFAGAGKLDTIFFAKSFFWIAFALFMVFLTVAIADGDKLRQLLIPILPVACLAFIFMFLNCLSHYPVLADLGETYYDRDMDTSKVNFPRFENKPPEYYIKSMEMDLHLGSTIKNICKVVFYKSRETEFIKLKIDEAFDIKAYYYGENSSKDGYITQYRQGDYLYIETGSLSQDEFELVFKYQGRLNYENGLHSKIFYSTNESSYLSHQFSWYPQIEDTYHDITFDVTIHANNYFVSNLSDGKLVKDKVYSNQVVLKQLYLVSGYFAEVEVEGRNCIIFEGYKKYEQAIAERAAIYIDEIQQIEGTPENTEEYILNNYSGGSYSQPYDSAKIKTVVFCPFYYYGLSLLDQYENTLFVCEAV